MTRKTANSLGKQIENLDNKVIEFEKKENIR